jgi:hypothetical protein
MQARLANSHSSFPFLRVVDPVASLESATPGEIAQRLAAQIANAADADQWAIVVDGVSDTGPVEIEERVPRVWLEYLNSRRPAIYRLTLPLRSGHREIGIVRLGTTDPAGFGPIQITRARAAANAAAETLALRLDRDLGRRRRRSRHHPTESRVLHLEDYRAPRPMQLF